MNPQQLFQWLKEEGGIDETDAGILKGKYLH